MVWLRRSWKVSPEALNPLVFTFAMLLPITSSQSWWPRRPETPEKSARIMGRFLLWPSEGRGGGWRFRDVPHLIHVGQPHLAPVQEEERLGSRKAHPSHDTGEGHGPGQELPVGAEALDPIAVGPGDDGPAIGVPPVPLARP